ncbi:Protein STB5 [Candida tropicalis]
MIPPQPTVTKFRVKKPTVKSTPNSEQIQDISKLTSCLRCRKLKKKCDKVTPECLNCDKAGEECTYVPRKQRRVKNDTKSQPSNGNESIELSSSRSTDFSYSTQPQGSQQPATTITPIQEPLSLSPPSNLFSHFSTTNTPSTGSISSSRSHTPPILNSIDARAPNFHSYPKQISKVLISAVGIKTNSNIRLERTGIISRDKKISEYFVSMALTHVHNNLSTNDLVNVRNLTLLAVYSFFNPAEYTSWEIMGKVTRLAIHLGMNHKVPDFDSKNLTAQQLEMRYRLFWSVYNLDRLSSVSLGRPVAIHDDDINVPFPQILDDDETEDIAVNRLIINLRKLEGTVLRKVHSVNIYKNFANTAKSQDEVCQVILSDLRQEIEAWYDQAKSLDRANTSARHSVSFHVSIPWYAARYHHLLILLYRPSYLNPHPSQDLLDTLGKSCLETLAYTYKLFKAKLLPLNWTTLYRFLMVCTTILYCLCKWAIDLMESKTEICYCIEIFQAFGSDWIVAKKCAEVFKKIENKLLEITLSDGHVSDMDNLSKELLGASSSYHEILNVHSVDLCIDSEFMYKF